jgi:hypothetical protein
MKQKYLDDFLSIPEINLKLISHNLDISMANLNLF